MKKKGCAICGSRWRLWFGKKFLYDFRILEGQMSANKREVCTHCWNEFPKKSK